MNEENSEEDSDQTGDGDANGRPKCGRIGLEALVDCHIVGFAEIYICLSDNNHFSKTVKNYSKHANSYFKADTIDY